MQSGAGGVKALNSKGNLGCAVEKVRVYEGRISSGDV